MPIIDQGYGVLFLMTALGAGLFLSAISQTQRQANMMSFFFTTPAFMLSGFTFPIRNMPVVVQYLTYLNPLRYFMEIVRGIFLKGVGFPVLWPKMLALFVYGVVVLGMSAARFPQEARLAQQVFQSGGAGRKAHADCGVFAPQLNGAHQRG